MSKMKMNTKMYYAYALSCFVFPSTIARFIMASFLPLPLNPRLKRPDPTKNFWTFECDDFTTVYQALKNWYMDRVQTHKE